MKRRILRAFLIGVAVGVGGSYVAWRLTQGGGPLEAKTTRNVELEALSGRAWGARVERPGVQNFHRVSESLYRGAQPSAEGMRQLKEMGVRTVVNLRKFHSDHDEIGETGLGYERMYVNVLHPEDKEVVRFLQIVSDPDRQPVFVHCMHGSDRTGMMCAAYRVAIQGWGKEEAIQEWTEGGFGYHKSFGNLIKYFRQIDFEELRTRAGIEGSPSGGG